jgi:hypothetical protein
MPPATTHTRRHNSAGAPGTTRSFLRAVIRTHMHERVWLAHIHMRRVPIRGRPQVDRTFFATLFVPDARTSPNNNSSGE